MTKNLTEKKVRLGMYIWMNGLRSNFQLIETQSQAAFTGGTWKHLEI